MENETLWKGKMARAEREGLNASNKTMCTGVFKHTSVDS